MSEDLLDRWRLAKDVYAVVSETPENWSCRIGIYGKWGQGKTSLLSFIETQARADGFISFWVIPSQAENIDGLWRVVLEAFMGALDLEGVLLDEVRGWRVKLLASKTEPLDKLAELNQYAKALVGFGRAAIKEWLRPDGEQIKRLRAKLHSKRVLVFIDDLDRTDPELVPILLLGLRDLLDLPGFCFLLAFDERIISETLARVNPAWGDGKAFIDKILDFSFSLPEPTPAQRLELVKHHIRELCPWMNLEVVEQNSDLLPESPRKLKALLRNLMTLSALVRRHDRAEIQWLDLFFGQLLRLESPSFIEQFLRDGNGELVRIGRYVPPRKDEPSLGMQVEAAVEKSGVDDEVVRSRLVRILTTWSARRFGGTKYFGYYAGFGSIHRDITQGEFDALVNGYRELGENEQLEAKLTEHATRVSSLQTDVAHEFLRLLVEARGAYLEEAADREMESDTLELLARAGECLDMIGSILAPPRSFFAITPDFSRTLVESLVGQILKWVHFDRSVYQHTRQQEKQFLLLLSRQPVVGGLDWLELLTPWKDGTLYFSEAARATAGQLIAELLQNVEDRVVEEAMESFAREGMHLQFYGAKATRASRFCFFEVASPLWRDAGRLQLFGMLDTANQNRSVRENAGELLRCLSWSTGRDDFSGNQEEHKKILLLPGVAKALWAATTAQRVSYRFQQRLLETRTAILGIGIDSDQLPIPEWLLQRARELLGGRATPEVLS